MLIIKFLSRRIYVGPGFAKVQWHSVYRYQFGTGTNSARIFRSGSASSADPEQRIFERIIQVCIYKFDSAFRAYIREFSVDDPDLRSNLV